MPFNKLKHLLDSGKIITAHRAFDPLSALLVRNARFEAVYVSGSNWSYTQLGLLDLGFLLMDDMIR